MSADVPTIMLDSSGAVSNSTSTSMVRFWASTSSTYGATRTTLPVKDSPGCESIVIFAACPTEMRFESTSSMGALM